MSTENPNWRELVLADALHNSLRDCVPCRGTGLCVVRERGQATLTYTECPRCRDSRTVLMRLTAEGRTQQ